MKVVTLEVVSPNGKKGVNDLPQTNNLLGRHMIALYGFWVLKNQGTTQNFRIKKDKNGIYNDLLRRYIFEAFRHFAGNEVSPKKTSSPK